MAVKQQSAQKVWKFEEKDFLHMLCLKNKEQNSEKKNIQGDVFLFK